MNKYQEDFEPVLEGMSFSNIDCKGFPNSVTISNGKDLYNFETRDYVPLEAVEELIEKATQKKPKKQLIDNYCRGIPGETPNEKELNYFCSNCNELVGDEGFKYNYCPNCSQAIDWSDNETT